MNYNEEHLGKFIAQMNVFSQHKKVMEEIARPKRSNRKKNKKKQL